MSIMSKIIKLFSSGLHTYAGHHRLQKPALLAIKFPKLCYRRYSSSNTMKVTILGAGGNIGKSVSLMLKQSPFIDELCLYDSKPLESFADDLNYIDTKCRATSYTGSNGIQHALSRSNIILVFAHGQQSDGVSYSDLFDKNAPIIKEFAVNIAKYSPKSFIAIATEPINSMVPMFSEVMKKHGHYNPHAIFGVTTIDVVRANKFVADVLGLDPECVMVSVIGGHTEKTLVPLLSKAIPSNELSNEEIEDITTSVRQADDNLLKVRSDGAYLSHAFAAARFIISLVKALRGQTEIVECAYVRSSVHGQLKYMVTPLLLGPAGIVKNYGVPELTDYEACLLENAIPLLIDDIKKGEFVGGRAMVMVDGKLQDKPLCDPCEGSPKPPRCPPDHCELKSFVENN